MLAPYGHLIATAIRQGDPYATLDLMPVQRTSCARPYAALTTILPSQAKGAPHDHIYDVVGGLCENNDKFAINRPLPQIELGDLVVIHDGARLSMGYNYNGQARSAEVLLRADGSTELFAAKP